MIFKSPLLAKLAVVSALALTSVAQAATYNFTLTGDYTASWQLNSNPEPDDLGEGEGFVIWDVVGNFPGAAFPALGVDLYFWNADIGGGLMIDDFYGETTLVSTDGGQLYTGSEAAPQFTLGTFALTEYQGTGLYSLTISAVPEPATVVSMLAGLGMIGVVLRRRRQETTEA